MIETNQSGVPGSPQSILQHVFGYHSFRGDQQAIIDTVTAGDDALVIIPTGGGKSLCYQIPALLRPGVAVVVSPLIALMQNQVAALKEQGVRAALLNSTLDGAALYAVERAMRDGELDIVYIAPERLIRDHTQALLQRCQLALFAIDEAHCVAQWGHDFRVDYLKLDILQNNFPRVPRIALTATADERTRQEIQQRLGLENARLFMSGFDRPNIQYRITPKDRPRDQLLAFLKAEQAGHSGIVYCLSRKKVDTTAHWLQTEGYNALPYHAGLEQTVRAENQDRFLREDNIVTRNRHRWLLVARPRSERVVGRGPKGARTDGAGSAFHHHVGAIGRDLLEGGLGALLVLLAHVVLVAVGDGAQHVVGDVGIHHALSHAADHLVDDTAVVGLEATLLEDRALDLGGGGTAAAPGVVAARGERDREGCRDHDGVTDLHGSLHRRGRVPPGGRVRQSYRPSEGTRQSPGSEPAVGPT